MQKGDVEAEDESRALSIICWRWLVPAERVPAAKLLKDSGVTLTAHAGTSAGATVPSV